jgi:hypothetical protein
MRRRAFLSALVRLVIPQVLLLAQQPWAFQQPRAPLVAIWPTSLRHCRPHTRRYFEITCSDHMFGIVPKMDKSNLVTIQLWNLLRKSRSTQKYRPPETTASRKKIPVANRHRSMTTMPTHVSMEESERGTLHHARDEGETPHWHRKA